MLLEYGNVHCGPSWKVEEKTAVGFCRIYHVYSGVVDYIDAKQVVRLKPGYLYIFPSATAYSMKQDVRKRLRCTFMHIDFSPSVLNDVIEIPIGSIPALKYILLSIKESIAVNDVKTINMLASIFTSYCIEHNYVPSPEDKISRVLSYISEQITEKITVKKLSRIAGYNDQYFIRLFKQKVGSTPCQYIINYRLREAKKLLLSGASISQIAEMTGYSDIKTFSRAFRNRFGMSPTMYRNTYVGQP